MRHAGAPAPSLSHESREPKPVGYFAAGRTTDAGYIVRNGVVEEIPTPDAGEFMSTLRRLADADSLDPVVKQPRESTPETLTS